MNNAYVNMCLLELLDAENDANTADELLLEATERLALGREALRDSNIRSGLAEMAARAARARYDEAEESDLDELWDLLTVAEDRVLEADDDVEGDARDIVLADIDIELARDATAEAHQRVLEARNIHQQAHIQHKARYYAMKEGGPACIGG